MEWNKVKVPSGVKLFKIHKFLYLHQGTTYSLEVNEYADGLSAGYGEVATDKSQQLNPVNGKSVEECLNGLIERILKAEGSP